MIAKDAPFKPGQAVSSVFHRGNFTDPESIYARQGFVVRYDRRAKRYLLEWEDETRTWIYAVYVHLPSEMDSYVEADRKRWGARFTYGVIANGNGEHEPTLDR